MGGPGWPQMHMRMEPQGPHIYINMGLMFTLIIQLFQNVTWSFLGAVPQAS